MTSMPTSGSTTKGARAPVEYTGVIPVNALPVRSAPITRAEAHKVWHWRIGSEHTNQVQFKVFEPR